MERKIKARVVAWSLVATMLAALAGRPISAATPAPAPSSPVTTASLAVASFDDLNGDGRRDAGEPLLQGVRFQVLDADQKPLHTALSDGRAAITFSGLAAGSYVVLETNPRGYESVTPDQWAIALVPGSSVQVEFANRLVVGAAPTRQMTGSTVTASRRGAPGSAGVEPTAGPASGGFWQRLHGVSGLLVACLALAILTGLWLWRRLSPGA